LIIRVLSDDQNLYQVDGRYYQREERSRSPMTERQVRERYELIFRRGEQRDLQRKKIIQNEIESLDAGSWFGVIAIPDVLIHGIIDFETWQPDIAENLRDKVLWRRQVNHFVGNPSRHQYTERGFEYGWTSSQDHLLRVNSEAVIHVGDAGTASVEVGQHSMRYPIAPPRPSEKWRHLLHGREATTIVEFAIRAAQLIWREAGLRSSATLCAVIKTAGGVRLLENHRGSFSNAGMYEKHITMSTNEIYDDNAAIMLTRKLMGHVLRCFGLKSCLWIDENGGFHRDFESYVAR